MRRTLLAAVLLCIGATLPAQTLDEAVAANNRGDFGVALRAYMKLAGEGNASAKFHLGVMYAQGEGVPVDEVEAARWYRIAADQGLAEAQFALGLMYQASKGVAGSKSEAARWYRSAAVQGFVHAQVALGRMYDSGEGVVRDPTEATHWFARAANHGDPDALFSLAARNALGEGGLEKSGAAAAQRYYEAGLAYLKNRRKERALLCVERIQGLRDNLGHAVPNVFLGERLMEAIYGVQGRSEAGPGGMHAGASVVSGTAWALASGYFVTNFHVVGGRKAIEVWLDNGKRLVASIAASDPANDLALLAPANVGDVPAGLAVAISGAAVGSRVFTLGYPHPDVQGSELKLTDGVVSALSGIGSDVRAYQLSVPVQDGNSGGPVLNMTGEVVAVVIAKLDAAKMFQWTGDLPENVSYGVKVIYLHPLMMSVRPLRSPKQVRSGSADLAALTERVRGSVALVIAE